MVRFTEKIADNNFEMPEIPTENQCWNVYMVRCSDGSLYTGIAKYLDKRIDEHNNSNMGAKYTRTRRPVTLAYSETHPSRSAACKREAVLKSMSKAEKEALIVA